MYSVELSEWAMDDLGRLNQLEIELALEIFYELEIDPVPDDARPYVIPEAADGVGYRLERSNLMIYYNIFELAKLVKVVEVERKQSLN